MILRGERVMLRTGDADDVPRLASILHEPEVASRWGSFTDAQVADQFIDDDVVFVVTLDGEVIGAIQYDEEEDPTYRHAGIDIFLAAAHRGRGLGTDAVRTLAQYLYERRGHHRLTIDPARDNAPAIRAYERVGFRTVGVMRAYERGPDGTWHDGLLMEMLADEFEQRNRERDP